jgi:hypothetical protein
MLLMDNYYYGDHPLPFVTKAHNSKMHDEFRKLLEDSRSNFMRLIVDAAEERLKVEGFRLSASTDTRSDQPSWDIWQANSMDEQAGTAFLESLIKGVAYVSVWYPEPGEDYAQIQIEDPLQTIVAYVPGTNFRKRAAALKVWRDEWTGQDRANVYLAAGNPDWPAGIYKYRASTSQTQHFLGTPAQQALSEVVYGQGWEEIPDSYVDNPLGILPIVPLRNRPRLLLEGESEIADVYRIQNQINGFLFLLAIAGYFGAHRQRWAVGMSLMVDESGKPPFDIAVDRLIVSESKDTQFGDFAQTDLAGYISAIDQKIQHLAITTRTPKHYLLPTGQEPSGDALNAAESGLVKKVERKQRPFGEGLEEAIRLARLFQGSADAPVDSELVWAPAATPTVSEVTDAVIKRFLAGLVPWETSIEDLGYTQTQLARMLQQFNNLPPAAPVPTGSVGVRG